MESSPETPQQQENSAQGRTLQVDFPWKKVKVLITENDDPESKPVYVVDCKTIKALHLIFKSAADDSTFGTGTLLPISINANCELHGQPVELKTVKRFKTHYEHLSRVFSDTDAPVPMTWTSNSGFKVWDFVCLDVNQLPVAKFSANIWAAKKVGNIEFLGSKANSNATRDEIVVTELTLFYCMLLRTRLLDGAPRDEAKIFHPVPRGPVSGTGRDLAGYGMRPGFCQREQNISNNSNIFRISLDELI
jgi:hypothetical protein